MRRLEGLATIDRREERAQTAARGPAAPRIRYAAMVLGDGTLLPITRMVGRRIIGEIDPLSSEGRRLLRTGRVTLCFADGTRIQTASIQSVLAGMESSVRAHRDGGPGVSDWKRHHDRVLRSIGRMKRRLRLH